MIARTLKKDIFQKASVSNVLCQQSCLLFVFIFSLIISVATINASQDFPIYPAIQDNVKFWKNIYSIHSIDTAVIHDKNHLERVYLVIKLPKPSGSAISNSNKKKINKEKTRLKTILSGFSHGKKPKNDFEKKVFTLFPKNASSQEFKLASSSIRVQYGLKERFLTGVIQSGAYMAEIKNIFRSNGLPEDLAYLPHVESSFNIKAYSKFGAAGIWQFTRSTGKQYMRIDYVVDERKDPIIAAHAAAKFLKNNYLELANWPMAITAYNYGKAGMRRAKAAKGTYENIFLTYNKGHFKFASKNFYSEFLAARQVAKRLEVQFQNKLDRPEKTLLVKMPAYADVRKLSKYLSAPLPELRRLNPALRSPVFEDEKYIPKNHYLRVSETKSNRLKLTHIPSSIFSNSQKKSTLYTVRSGDSASKIAHTQKVSLKKLVRENKLDANATVYIGQILTLPHDNNKKQQTKTPSPKISLQKVIPTSIPTLSDQKKSRVSPNLPPKPQPAAKPEYFNVGNIVSKRGVFYGEIITQPDESIGFFAEWLDITESQLRKLNTLPTTENIHPGQLIKLIFSRVSRQQFEEKRLLFHKETEDDFFASYTVISTLNYKVAKGDSLWSICYDKFEIPPWLLKKYNIKIDFQKLHYRQNLIIPLLDKN